MAVTVSSTPIWLCSLRRGMFFFFLATRRSALFALRRAVLCASPSWQSQPLVTVPIRQPLAVSLGGYAGSDSFGLAVSVSSPSIWLCSVTQRYVLILAPRRRRRSAFVCFATWHSASPTRPSHPEIFVWFAIGPELVRFCGRKDQPVGVSACHVLCY